MGQNTLKILSTLFRQSPVYLFLNQNPAERGTPIVREESLGSSSLSLILFLFAPFPFVLLPLSKPVTADLSVKIEMR